MINNETGGLKMDKFTKNPFDGAALTITTGEIPKFMMKEPGNPTAGSPGIFISADCSGFFHNVYKFNRHYSELRLPKECMLIVKDQAQDFLEVGMAPKSEMNYEYVDVTGDNVVKVGPVFDEQAERADFCKTLIKKGYHPAQLAKMPGDGDYIVAHVQQQWTGYLACARLKAGQPS